jgi:hypothetical protein
MSIPHHPPKNHLTPRPSAPLAPDVGSAFARETHPGESLPPFPCPRCGAVDVPHIAHGSVPDPRAWLEHIPPQRRSLVANYFHYSVRAGAKTPPGVCAAVIKTVDNRLQSAKDGDTRQFLQGVVTALQTYQEEALNYASWVLRYEALPPDQRQRVKWARATGFLAKSMAGKEATPAQLSFLHGLGHRGEPPRDRAEASEMIGRLLQQKGGGR